MEERMRNATFARIGRSYPRAGRAQEPAAPPPPARRLAARYGALAGMVALILALALIGWLLAAHRPI
jgi:cytochrome b561